MVARIGQGQFSTGADFAGLGPRFFFGGVHEGSKLYVRAWTKQVPEFAFRDAKVNGDVTDTTPTRQPTIRQPKEPS